MLAQTVKIAAIFILMYAVTADLDAYTILEKFEEAKRLAEKLEVSYSTKKEKSEKIILVPQGEGRKPLPKKVVTRYEVLHRTVALIGLHKESGGLKTVTFPESFALELKRRPKETAPEIIGQDGGCEIWWNGGNRYGLIINLSFQCGEKRYAVLRIKRWMVFSSREITTKGARRSCIEKRKVELVSYTPHSPEISDPEIVARGKKYVEDVMRRTFDDLSERNIPSRAFTQEVVGETTSLDLPLWFSADEHMDHERFYAAQRDGTVGTLIDEFFWEFGANLEETKRWSISLSNAFGIAQFICPTYLGVLNEYPGAELNPNFLDGMRDHVNAFKAMILLWDSDMGKLWNAKTKKICGAAPETLEECWAASYNGGPGRLNRVVQKRGGKWDQKGPTVRNKRRYYAPTFRDETYTYIEKLRAIREYFLKEKQNTP